MLTLFFRQPIGGTKLEHGRYVPWEVTQATFAPRGEGDPVPEPELLKAVRTQMVDASGKALPAETLATYNLNDGIRDAMGAAMHVEVGMAQPAEQAL